MPAPYFFNLMRGMTRQEKQEAEAAIYGLHTPMSTQQIFTPEQIEQMRQLVAQFDQANGGSKPGQIREFDLNKPERSPDWKPYRFQRYPMHLHDHEKRVVRVVNNKKEEDAALKEGLLAEPFPAEVPETPEEAADRAEIERLDKLARAPKGTRA